MESPRLFHAKPGKPVSNELTISAWKQRVCRWTALLQIKKILEALDETKFHWETNILADWQQQILAYKVNGDF